MSLTRVWSPAATRRLQLAASLLVVLYMLFVGGTFAASLVYEVKLLNALVGGALVLAWIAARLIQRRALVLTGIELPLVAFAASQWIAVAASVQPRLGLDWAAGLLAWIIFFWLVTDLLANGWPRAYWLNALVLVAVIIAANGLWLTAQWFAHWAALGQLAPVAFRLDGLLEQANLTACVINLLWPIVVVRAMQAPGRPARVALFALAGALAIVEFFTSSRGGWIAAAAGLATLVALLAPTAGLQKSWQRLKDFWRSQARVKQLAALAAILAVAAGLAWLLARETLHVTHGSLLQSRDTFWSTALTLFLAHPLFGAGPDLFPWFYPHFYSIPPDFFPPSAHSMIMQILSGSGLLGLAALLWLAASLARKLWARWRASGGSLELAGLAASLVSFGVHHLFDYPLTAFILMLIALIAALALAPAAGQPARRLHPAAAVPLAALTIGVFAFILRAAGTNAAGLALADSGQWQPAAQAFQRAAQLDPGLPLYLEEAAYAYTRAGDGGTALPLWQQAAHDDPYWALVPANIGALSHNLAAAQAAQAMAPRSQMFALNAGAVAEAVGDQAAAQQAYQSALDLKPTSAAALYWQQTPLRATVLAHWQSQQAGAGTSALVQAQAMLARGDAAGALPLFQQAIYEDPEGNAAYLGLAESYLLLHDSAAANRYFQAGVAIPVVAPEDTIGFELLAGDLAAARGDQSAAALAYGSAFYAIDDYDIAGPGSYGFPQRSRIVFHQLTLPGEVVPQMARADITPDMDARFGQLAQWDLAAGQHDVACHILQRVYQEAPASISGRLYGQLCPAS